MGSAERHQPAFDREPALLERLRGAQALRGDRHHGRKRVLHTVMQLLQQQALQVLGGLILGGVDAGLGQQTRGVDLRLREKFAQTRVLGFERVFLVACRFSRHDDFGSAGLPAL